MTIMEKYRTIEMNLQKLPGVGRKTANVVVSVARLEFRQLLLIHMWSEVSKRLAMCRWKDSVLEVEKTLMKKVPMDEWGVTHHRMMISLDVIIVKHNDRNVRNADC